MHSFFSSAFDIDLDSSGTLKPLVLSRKRILKSHFELFVLQWYKKN